MVRKNLETKNEVDNLNALTKQSLLFNDRLTVDLKRQRAVTSVKNDTLRDTESGTHSSGSGTGTGPRFAGLRNYTMRNQIFF